MQYSAAGPALVDPFFGVGFFDPLDPLDPLDRRPVSYSSSFQVVPGSAPTTIPPELAPSIYIQGTARCLGPI